ncbi:hypothetical protein JD844_006147 [Phrynosoma platyrhinos]|uniref:Ig-like domain-containing protein n=1 Tax=Phrynosoma platyrhinos TaxID=52577 RepID=A0ABQ7TPH9_PHRPL|nr:hypothetical protein JD844_006147 [Phrynosoma platyrhinos]
MAPAARFLFLFLLALALASAAPSARTGPPRLCLRLHGRESGPILEGSDVTLECLFAGGQEGEGGEGAAGLAFQKYGQPEDPRGAARSLGSQNSGAAPRRGLRPEASSACLGASRGLEVLRRASGGSLPGQGMPRHATPLAGRLPVSFSPQWLHAWVSLEKGSKLPCCFYDVVVSQEGGRLLLTIRSVQSWHAGTYRCLSSNATSNASSAELDLQIEYLHGIFLSRANSWCGTVGDSVTVLEGDDLELRCSAEASRAPLYEWSREGEDWIVASSSLALAKVNQEQAGIYTCRARHPSVAQLAKSKSLRLFVEGSQRGLVLESALSLSTPTLALTVGLPALLLLMVIAVFALLIVRLRGQAAAKKKAAQEDPGQRTPIYKDSLESVPSVVRDTHPLVM